MKLELRHNDKLLQKYFLTHFTGLLAAAALLTLILTSPHARYISAGVIVSTALIGLILWFMFQTSQEVLSTDNRSLSIRAPYRIKTIHYHQVRGYVMNTKSITLIATHEPFRNSLTIDLTFNNNDAIINFIKANFKDLASTDLRSGNKNIPFDRLNSATKLNNTLHLVAMIATVWVTFIPYPYELSVFLAAAVIIATIVVVIFNRKIMKVIFSDHSVRPAVIAALSLPAVGLVVRAFGDFEVLNEREYVVICIWIAAALWFLLLLITGEILFRSFKEFFMGAVLGVVFFITTLSLYNISNCYYDTSEPDVYTTTITEMEIGRGRRSDRIYFEPWGPKQVGEMTVNRKEFNALNVGDTVTIKYRKGRFGSPWYTTSFTDPL